MSRYGRAMSEHPSLKTSSHDLPVSERLAEFMRTGWADTEVRDLVPQENAPFHARRRAALSARFPGETLVVPTGPLKVRANDTDYEFRPGTGLAWLTGEYEPDSVLVLSPETATLYRRPRSSRETDEFFRSRAGELWVGRRWSLAECEALLGIGCADLKDLEKALAELDPAATRVLRGVDPTVDATIGAADDGLRDGELAAAVSELRLVKDEWEIAQLIDAVDATVRGFTDVVRALPADRESSERLVDGVFGLRARHDGNLVGYGTIAAAGAHACTLHWWRNDGVCRPGELLLLDAGVENRHYYTADVTRTLPINGRFSHVQRRVYDLVHAAQEAGIAAVRPRSEEHTSELQSHSDLVCRLLLEKKKQKKEANCRTKNKDTTRENQRYSDPSVLLWHLPVARPVACFSCAFFFFNDTATTEIYTLSLHDALPIPRP